MKILNDRGKAYGHAFPMFNKLALLWSAYLGTYLSPQDAAMMMMLLKVGRLKNGGVSTDSIDDTIGYAMLYGELVNA